MIRKLLATASILALCLACIAGCEKKEDTGTPTPPSNGEGGPQPTGGSLEVGD